MNEKKKTGKVDRSDANFSKIKVIQQEFAREYICDYNESIFYLYQIIFPEMR